MQEPKIPTRQKLLILFFIVVIVAILARCCQGKVDVSKTLEFIEQAGLWAPFLYILLYILVSGIIIPSIIIKIFAGTLFGVVWGIVFVSIAATISSLVKFLIARYFFRESILRKVERSEQLKTLDQVIEKDGWKMLIILRNVPVINSMLLNYICGLSKMKVRDFVIASFIGRLPTTIMYVYLGYFVSYAYTIGMETNGARHPLIEKTVLFIGLVAVVAASFYLIHLSRKVLRKKAPNITVPR